MHDRLGVLLAWDNVWVVLADDNIESLLIRFRKNPRVVEICRGHLLKFRTPHVDELAFSVKFLRLTESVKVQYFAGAKAASCVPTSIV